MSDFGSGLRFALRALKAKPAFTAVAILSLALGIGANTAVFSVVESALLRKLPFHEPGRLVYITDHQPCCESVSLSPGEYLDYKQQSQTFEGIAAIAWQNMTLTGRAEAQNVKGRAVTTNFFDVLGARAELGRLMSAALDKAGTGERVAVISDRLWRSRFGDDRSIVGRKITLNGGPFDVVGVLAPQQEYPSDIDVWVSPRVSVPEYEEGSTQGFSVAQMYGTHWMVGLGRLKPGVTVERARAELRTIADRIDKAHDETGHWAVLAPLQSSLVETVRPALAVLGAAVLVLLLIACANLAGLMMAQSSGRSRELAVRVAIGATRRDLGRLLLSESLALAVLGGALGVALAYGALRLLSRYSPYELPTAMAPSLNLTVLIFCMGISFASALMSGLAPAFSAAQVDISESLKEASKGSAGVSSQRFRRVLVTGEIALSVMLLIGASLLVRSFAKLLAVPAGFESARVMTTQISLPPANYSSHEKTSAFWRSLLAAARALPGVESAGISSDIPVTGVSSGGDFEVEGHPVKTHENAPYASSLFISPGLIDTLKIRLLSGRDLSERDQQGAPPAVLVNRTLAERLFPGRSAVGKRLRPGNRSPWETIAGVVNDVKWEGLGAKPSFDVYRAVAQVGAFTNGALMVRMSPGAALPSSELRAVVRSMDPNVPLSQFVPLEHYVDESLGKRKFLLGILTGFSALAILLAAIGLYAVIAYSVQQRRREIGIRIAVGAARADVLWMILRECAGIAGVGVAIGVIGAVWSSAFLRTMLFGVSGTDVTAYGAAILLITGVALASSLIPAMRAARVDPLAALRYE